MIKISELLHNHKLALFWWTPRYKSLKTFKTFISNVWLSGNHSIAMVEIWCFEGKQKMLFFKKWVSQNMQKGMVPWLEIYFLISKTNLEILNFVLKFRSLKIIIIIWNSYLLERSQVKTCFVWVVTQVNSKVSVQQSNLQSLQENLWKFQLKVITGTHLKLHFFLATLTKFWPALPQNSKLTTWKLYFTSWQVREAVVHLCAQERTGISYSFAKNSVSLSLVVFEK